MTTYDTVYNATLKRTNPRELSARLAGKLAALILALTLVMGLLLCGVDRAFAGTMTSPVAKKDVLVRGENVKLGDVFDGLAQNSDFVLAPAPGPGEELVWNQPTLLRIATAFDLPWRPQDGEEVRIRRDAQLVDGDTLKTLIRERLAESNTSDTFNINFTSDVPNIVVPSSAAPRLDLSDFNIQPAGGTFSAIVKVSGADGSHQTVNLRGVAERMVRLPVLKSGLSNGQIIGAHDIVYVEQRSNSLSPNIVRDASALIGSTPKRTLGAGEIIRDDVIEKPRMISRGDQVTMVFNQNGMYLTTKGKAMEDGAMGDTIKVSNNGSQRMIEARVTNNKEVTVN